MSDSTPTLDWKPEYEDELVALLASVYPSVPTPPAPGEDRKRLDSFNGGAAQILHVTFCFFVGFNQLLKEPPAEVPQLTVEWVRTVDRAESGSFILGATATALIGLLEDCLVSFVPLRAPRDLLDTEKRARATTKGIKPTRDQTPEAWIENLRRVFGVSPPACVCGTLVSLTLFRNKFVHEPSGTRALVRLPAGDLAKSWVIAAQALVCMVYARPNPSP